MTRPRELLDIAGMACIALAALTSCERTGAVVREDTGPPPESDTGPPPDSGPEMDSGPLDLVDGGAGMVGPSIMYEPAGCGYTVRTPTVTEARTHSLVFGAAPTADHIHLSYAGPAESTFAVNWRSDVDTLSSLVLYGTDRTAVEAADGPGGGVSQATGHTMRYGTGATLTRIHEVHVCGLTANTTYYYRVGGPGHWSEVHSVSTAPPVGSSETWTFGVTGDSRGFVLEGTNVWAHSQERLEARGVDMEIFSGDAVFLGQLQDQWNAFFESSHSGFVVQDYLANVPFMVANGNHDNLAVPYLAQFALPQGDGPSPGETGQGEDWYSFDYANAHFIFLNDSAVNMQVYSTDEASWLRNDLMRVNRAVTPWVFVVHHRPFHTCLSRHRPDPVLRSSWQPLFDQYGVDLVFTGHNHVYERTRPIRGLTGGEGVVAPAGPNGIPTYSGGLASGTVYIVAAGVGAELYQVSNTCTTSYAGQAISNYLTVEITGDRLVFNAYSVEDDSVLDSFTLDKGL